LPLFFLERCIVIKAMRWLKKCTCYSCFAVLFQLFIAIALCFAVCEVQFVPGAPPSLTLISDGGDEETVAVQGWKVGQLESFLQQKLNQ
jgi:hypothetical protein